MVPSRPDPTPEQFAEALRRLPRIEREILVLGAHERLSNEAIALRLGLSTRSVERRLARALCRLDRALER